MPIWESIIDRLQEAYPTTLSIKSLADQLSQPAETIQEIVNNLVDQGFPITQNESIVSLDFPLLSSKQIKKYAPDNPFSKGITVFDSISSTNTYVKEHLSAIKDKSVFLAHEQTQGKGRLGRAWSSPTGKSLSMTIVLKPDNELKDASLLTQLLAAAVVKTLKKTMDVQIKWPNDIVINKKKVAGILTEAEFSGSHLEGIIIGMGVNTNLLNEDFPKELIEKASSLREITHSPFDPNPFLAEFFEHFHTLYQEYLETNNPESFLPICRTYSTLIGREMWAIESNTKRKIFIETIDQNGGLVVRDSETGEKNTLTSTHLSIRADESYL